MKTKIRLDRGWVSRPRFALEHNAEATCWGSEMRRTSLVICLVLLLCVAASAKKKDKKPSVDQRLLSAQYICITSDSGNDIDPRTQRRDRDAILRVENAIKAWGRYHVVYNEENADIVLVVRTGRVVGAGAGGPIAKSPVPIPGVPGPNGSGISIGGPEVREGAEMDVSNVPDDMISIYDARIGLDYMKSTSVLWRKIMAHGLGANPSGRVPLVESLKKEVEEAAQARTNSKP